MGVSIYNDKTGWRDETGSEQPAGEKPAGDRSAPRSEWGHNEQGRKPLPFPHDRQTRLEIVPVTESEDEKRRRERDDLLIILPLRPPAPRIRKQVFH